MKKLLFLLLFLPLLSVSAVTTIKSYTFDFTNPGSLLPPISNIGSAIGESVEIANKSFTTDDGMLSMTITMGTMISPRIVRGNNGQTNLQMSPYSNIVFSVAEGSHITGVRIPGTNNIGVLTLFESVPESIINDSYFGINRSQTYYEWPVTAEGNSMSLTQECTSLTFQNAGPTPSAIQKIIVDYQIDMLDYSISLPSGTVESIPQDLTLTFAEPVGSVNSSSQAIITDETGAEAGRATASLIDNQHVKLSLSAPITEIGIYTLSIPDKLVYDAEGTHFNAPKTFTYRIGNLASEATKEKARALLALTGPGYPSQNSEARQALSNFGPKASEEDYQVAIANYYACTDVEMPANSKYYHVIAVGKGGGRAYLQYADGVLSLTMYSSNAVSLLAEADGASVKFKTPDGKYITLPGATSTSISDGAVPLTFAKMALVEGSSYEEVFGMFSIYGSAGSGNTYALANVEVPSLMTNESITTLFFTNSLTSAFIVEETSAPGTVTVPDEFVYDFMKIADVYWKESVAIDEPVKDVALNNFTYYSYDTEIGVSDTEVALINYHSNDEIARGTFKVVASDPDIPSARSIVKLQLNKTITEGSLPAGQYCYRVFAGTIGDKNFGEYNADPAAFLASGKKKSDCHTNSYVYYIVTVNNNYVPDPEKPKPSAEVLAKARQAVGKTGVGYPAANAQTRQTLQSLVNSGEGTNDDFIAAMQAYFAETNIQLPTTGNYYNICAVSASNVKAYLQDLGTLTADASKAGAFKAGGSGNAITFENKNGKFLTVLSAAGSLTDAFSATDNNLTLARYPVSGNNAEATFGLITISGNKGGTTMMSQVNVSNMAITTSGNTAVFTNDATSAFRFADTSEPTPDPVPDAQYTLSPASGSQVSGTKLDVTLTFKGITNVTVADRTKIKLVHGEQVVQATSVTAQQENTQFAIVFNGLATGTYTLQIEKGAFTYPYNGKTAAVQAITATYDMTEKAVPSQEVLAKAEALLAKTGVGYPTADSPARLALKKLVDAKAGTNNEFNAAIDAYLADTNIEKPANGKYYRMVTRSKAFQSYFALDGSKLKLQADAEGAAVFKATANADGTTALMAVNDKYLSLPTATGDYLSFNYDKAAHDLTLSRLNVSGVSNEETFGLISMSLGGKYAVMTLDETTATVQEPRSNATYGSYQTSALKFEEASELEITMPDVDYTVTPGANTQVESMEKITIVFANRNEVKLKDASKIKLLDAITDKVYLPKSVTKVEGTQNTFDMTFINLPARTYNLNIAKGAFVVNFLGREEPVQEIVVKYITVTKEPALAKDFDTYYNLRWVDRGYAYVTDVSLNNFRLKANTAIELINNAPQVKITTWSNYDVRATGHFEKTADSNVVLLVLDKEIKEGDLKAGEYNVHIEEKTLCDANYIQYLADNSSVSLSSCHVNPKVKFTVNVDNEKAAQGIEELLAADSEKYPVYDLMGRKVDGPLVPGKVYLCNGKKYVVKK